VLAPVLDYDERTGAGLLATLQAFLDCSGSWSRVAEQLHLHVNTCGTDRARGGTHRPRPGAGSPIAWTCSWRCARC